MSKSPFWGTVTHVLVPIYILQALSMRSCLNQLTMSSVTCFIAQANVEFISAKTNATEKYGEDLEKMKVNGLGKQKLGQGRNYGTD